MQDLQIAYYLLVIIIGFAALAIAGSWAFKTKEAYLWNFCLLYAAFTLVLIFSVLNKYLSLNVEGYTPQAWYELSGISIVLELSVIVAAIHFFVNMHQIRLHRLISAFFLSTALICIGLILSPLGTRLDTSNAVIRFGIGMKIGSVWYVSAFTIAILIGISLLRSVWKTDQRNFILGSLLFAGIGYIESLSNLPGSLRADSAVFRGDTLFLYSSIPYALYGLFLINHFLHFSPHTPIGLDQVSAAFLSAHNITDREREIIEKVIQGKSNADIASELVISLATVKTHLHNIYQKVGVDSRFDLLARIRSSSRK